MLSPLAPFTNRITYLEDGDLAVVRRDSIAIYDADGNPIQRAQQTSVGSALMVDKGNHRHFMIKEIYEQPEVIGHTLANYVDFNSEKVALRDMGDRKDPLNFADLDRLNITACGTALSGRISVQILVRTPRPPACGHRCCIRVSLPRSAAEQQRPFPCLFPSRGETADTLAGLKYCEAAGQQLAAIVNVRESTIARSCQSVFPTLAGPEIGVASTKAFTCQLSVLAALAVGAGVQRGHIDSKQESQLVRDLAEAPRYANEGVETGR